MKYILTLTLLFATLFSNEEQEVTIGAGPYTQTQPYANVDDMLLLSPVIFYDNGPFYIRWSRYGVYFLGEKSTDISWGLSLTAKPRVYGYDSSDIQGMDERKTSIETGLAFSVVKGNSHLEIIALTDPIYENSAWIIESELGHDFKLGNLSVYPNIFAIYQSSDFTNYYYGITTKEASIRGENSYIPTSGYQIGLQSYFKYPLTKKLSAFCNIRVDKLSSEAAESPLVNDKYIYSGLASLIYTWEY